MLRLNQEILDLWEKPSTTLHSVFRRTAGKYPERVALVDGDNILSYQVMDQWSDSLAGYLQQSGVRSGDVVGIYMEKCHEYILACLAILKAGGAYLPLELAYPPAMLQYIFEEAKPAYILTKSSKSEQLPISDVPFLEMDRDAVWKRYRSVHDEKVTVTAKNIAILGYSSGTTGKPKGIPVSHRATLYAHAKFWEEVWNLGDIERFAFTTFMAWDAVSPFQMGATGFIVPDHLSGDPKYLAQFIEEHQINHTVLTPSLLSSLLNRLSPDILKKQLKSLNILWVGGEVSTPELVNRTLKILPELNLINNYGPVECFVIAQGLLKKNDPASPLYCPVGYVLKGMEIKILNGDGRQVSTGEPGELYATGPCLADGYLNNEELTRAKFINIEGKTYYKTEDRAFLLPDGRLVVQGRSDSVVKLRSYHVNLSAIEEILRKHAHILNCAVVAYGSHDDQYLVAYVVKDDQAVWNIDFHTGRCQEIISMIKPFLPHYMIPSVYVELSELPLHPVSRKIDREQLPCPPARKQEAPRRYCAVNTGMSIPDQEALLVEMVEDLLNIEKGFVSKEDNFFELGLHSLLFVKLTMQIEEAFQTALKVEQLYRYATVRELVAFLNHHRQAKPASIRQDAVLDPAIKTVSSSPPPKTSSTARHLLLTGATGFLGSFLLHELLRQSSAHIHCLVRKNKSHTEEKQRIIAGLSRYRLWDSRFESRIIPVPGALEEDHWGWSEAQYSEYAEKIDSVFHSAAMVNLLYPYSLLKPVNVKGTHEIIRFAFSKKTKPLHYLSTLGIFPIRDDIYATENHNISEFAELLENGYTQSKWVAENIVSEAIRRGLPAVIYRPGNMGADSRHHLGNPNDAQGLIIKACKILGMTPENTGWFFETTSVDFIAKAIVEFSKHERHWNQIYHIALVKPISAWEIFELLHKRGLVDRRVQADIWIQSLYDYAKQKDDVMLRLLAETLRLEQQYMGEKVLVDVSAFEQACSAYNLERPQVNAESMLAVLTQADTRPAEINR